jgi:hypothetical protein
VIFHPGLKAGFEDLFGQVAQQPARADEVDPVSSRLLDKLFCD